MTMYMDYTDDRGMYMFSNGQNQEWLQFFFPVDQELVSDYNFLFFLDYKTRYLLASFFIFIT
jgi:hypothetical protein